MDPFITQLEQPAVVTFAVSDVKRATRPLPEVSYADGLAATIGQDGGVIEAYSRHTKPLVSPGREPAHTFLYAVNLAYDEHRPLVLSPDMIWLLVAQGVAQHINASNEALRSRFVAHTGKAKITVQRDEFVRGFAGNDWEGVFAEFSEQIRAHIGEQGYRLIVRPFSTTGTVEQAAFEVTLMDAFRKYFDYDVVTFCGIPEITLEGTPEDWRSVRAGAAALAEYDLHWWTQHLLPVLDRFVAASEGNVDRSFWRNFYKVDNTSGGPYINGHVVNLFPYLAAPPRPRIVRKRVTRPRVRFRLSPDTAREGFDEATVGRDKPSRNRYLGWEPTELEDAGFSGITSGFLPPALSVAPFLWRYWDETLPMEFVAGFVGVAQNTDTLALRPEIGWGVRERRPVG